MVPVTERILKPRKNEKMVQNISYIHTEFMIIGYNIYKYMGQCAPINL